MKRDMIPSDVLAATDELIKYFDKGTKASFDSIFIASDEELVSIYRETTTKMALAQLKAMDRPEPVTAEKWVEYLNEHMNHMGAVEFCRKITDEIKRRMNMEGN